jgi:hypothetical protein
LFCNRQSHQQPKKPAKNLFMSIPWEEVDTCISKRNW